MQPPRYAHMGALVSIVVMICWLVAWELWVAPLKPGGSMAALKAVPLLLPLRGVIKRDLYTMQWSSMLILLYFIEGVVRAWADAERLSRIMAMGEVLLVLVFFASCLLYLAPFKREAKRIAKELLDKVNANSHER